MLEIVSVALPEFVRVTVCIGLVVPTVWLPNAIEVGTSLTAGAAPVPDKAAFIGVLDPVSAIERFAVRAPAACGVNVTCTEQLEFPDNEAGQLLV